MNIKNLIPLICLVIAFFIIFGENYKPQLKNAYQIQSLKNSVKNSAKNDNSRFQKDTFEGVGENVDIAVNYPISLSYKTKKDIYNIRKNYVEKSIFARSDYEPSEEVFGMIASFKPWMSVNFCKDKKDNLASIDGASEEARFIINPAMLVAIEYPFVWSSDTDSAFCNNYYNQLIPQKISFSKEKREIVVEYQSLPLESSERFFYTFNGLNARDLGYRYAYMDLSQSDADLTFSNSNQNISNQVIEFSNFIHLGSSCEHNGGCNNGSPRQTYLEFYAKNNQFIKGTIYIKLWKSKPNSANQEPDIVEKIIIKN